jgi:hypothetical protein
MAATYTLYGTSIAYAAGASYRCSLFNGSGSGVILRVYRIWMVNAQSAAATGVAHYVDLRRLTACATPTTTGYTIAKHDTASSNLPAQVIYGSAGTNTATDTFRRMFWQSEEMLVSNVASTTSFPMFLPLACIWDAGYGDNGVGIEPIVCREGQGVTLQASSASTASGSGEHIIEFTSGAS